MRPTARLSFISLLATLLVSTPADAASRIYKTVDENGNVVYTDVAPKEPGAAEEAEVILSEPNRYERPEAVLPNDIEQALEELNEAAEAFTYSNLAITAPASGQTIRSNGGMITLSAAVTPGLAPAHQLRFFLDGSPVGTTPSNSMSLENVDRGEHSAQVIVIDERGLPVYQ
ncbi:MAG: DUF4124 domain-containing protein, partial [Pseudomonadota bacterium]